MHIPLRPPGRLRALAAATVLLPLAAARPAPAPDPAFTVLVFSETAGYRHDSQITAGRELLEELGRRVPYRVVASESSAVFDPQRLAEIDVVVFLQTTGDVLEPAEQQALRAFVEQGGGFVGVHSAADTEYDWPFYGRLVGAWFANHPAVQTATLVVNDPAHVSTAHLPPTLQHTDEWYNFRTNPAQDPNLHVLLSVDESTYSGGTMGGSHPIAWSRSIGQGRSWYTALGHWDPTYDLPWFQRHLLGGLLYAARLD